jgi:hypothetical protein
MESLKWLRKSSGTVADLDAIFIYLVAQLIEAAQLKRLLDHDSHQPQQSERKYCTSLRDTYKQNRQKKTGKIWH